MEPRLVAIGDIHGCDQALATLIEALELHPDDTLVTLGDAIDRGPNSKAVLEILLETANRCRLVPLLGNHEEMLLAAIAGVATPETWLRHGGGATLDSYGDCGDLSQVPQSHLDFLQNCRPYYETDTHFFVHANYDPQLPLAQQTPHALRWQTLQQRTPGPHCSGKTAVLGHTADTEGQIFDLGYLKCIDTYCYGGGWLTALEVGSGRFWQASRSGRLRTGKIPTHPAPSSPTPSRWFAAR